MIDQDTATMDVNWLPYLDNVAEVSIAEVQSIETRHGMNLPEPYKRDLNEHAGMAPERDAVQFERGGTGFGPLLILAKTNEENYSYSIAYSIDALAQWSGKADWGDVRLWPFATNTATGLFCFDFRTRDIDPPVVFVDLAHDADEAGAIKPVAESYAATLDKLR